MSIDDILDKFTDQILLLCYKFTISNLPSEIAIYLICLHLMLSCIQITYFEILLLFGVWILFLRIIFFMIMILRIIFIRYIFGTNHTIHIYSYK
jgi:hypothetical protein